MRERERERDVLCPYRQNESPVIIVMVSRWILKNMFRERERKCEIFPRDLHNFHLHTHTHTHTHSLSLFLIISYVLYGSPFCVSKSFYTDLLTNKETENRIRKYRQWKYVLYLKLD